MAPCNTDKMISAAEAPELLASLFKEPLHLGRELIKRFPEGVGLGRRHRLVVPVVGALLGFPAGVFIAELARLRHAGAAWTATWDALKGVGRGIAIQVGAGVLMIGVWLTAVWVT